MTDTEVLERIAIALEQLVLAYMDSRAPLPTPDRERPPAPAPNGPVAPVETQSAPFVPPPPVQPFQTPVYVVGSIHAQGHKPLKLNQRGLFCPTKLADGSWCAWRATP